MLIRCLMRGLSLQDSGDRFVYHGQYQWVSLSASQQEILGAKQDTSPDLIIERLLGLALLPETLQRGPYVGDALFGASMLFRCQALGFGNKVLRGELGQGDSSVRNHIRLRVYHPLLSILQLHNAFVGNIPVA